MSQHPLWFLGTLTLLIGTVVLLIAAEATATQGVSTAIPAVTLLVAIPAFLSLLLHMCLHRRIKKQEQRNDDGDYQSSLIPPESTKKLLKLLESGLRPTTQSVALFIAPSISLFFVILLRLVIDVDNFQGDPANLDFGPKDGIEGGEENISFTNEFNSYGHALQGVFAAMLAFPAVSGLVTQILTCRWKGWWVVCNKPLWSLLKLTSALLTIYPSYCLVKRFIRTGDTFATSSFANNALEWAAGFLIGISFGNLISALVKLFVTAKVNQQGEAVRDAMEESDGESWVFGTQRGSDSDVQPRLRGLMFLLGILLMFSVFSAAALFGITWHNCIGEGDDCVNYSEEGTPIGILAILVMVPSVIILVVSCGECMRLRK